MTYCFMTVRIFYEILVSPNYLKAYRHASSACILKIKGHADDINKLLACSLSKVLFQNIETAVTLVQQSYPLEIELHSAANEFLCR